MELHTSKETVIKVDYGNLDEFIAEAYGLDNFEGTLESSNDTDHRFDISEPDTVMFEKFGQEDLKKIIEAKSCEYYHLGTVLEDLARKGKIERGVYLVQVCW